VAKTRARALWSGSVSFGLVNIPVRLYTATAPHAVHFHELQRGTGQRIHHKRVAERSGREVAYQDIVKGYELQKNRYVAIEPEELEAIEPRKTHTLDIEAFVDLHEIDPIAWADTYYVGPGDQAGAAKSYELLRRGMEEMGKVAVGRFVMRTKGYLATVRPFGRGLALATMYYADEIRAFSEVVELPSRSEVAAKELALARQLIDSLAGPWRPESFEDTYQSRVKALIARKAKGEEIVREEAPAEPPEVVDLMEALKASLGGGRKAPARRAARGKAGTKRTGRKRREAAAA
jgi:DNA end-binding protein Ku